MITNGFSNTVMNCEAEAELEQESLAVQVRTIMVGHRPFVSEVTVMVTLESQRSTALTPPTASAGTSPMQAMFVPDGTFSNTGGVVSMMVMV